MLIISPALLWVGALQKSGRLLPCFPVASAWAGGQLFPMATTPVAEPQSKKTKKNKLEDHCVL